MTTAELPPHGTYKRANGGFGAYPACHCDPCRAVARAQRKAARYRQATGRSFRVPAGAARERLHVMRRDMTWAAIAKATNCDPTTLQRVANGEHHEVQRATHNKIMAAAVQPSPERGRYLDATGTIRRIRALKVMGYSYPAIAAASGIEAMHISHIAAGHLSSLRQKTATRIARAYKQLVRKPVPNDRYATRARNGAAAQGWHGPLAWDTDTIDDPAAQPDLPVEADLKLPAELQPCGTPAAYRRHLRRKEPIDTACREANRREQREKAARTKTAAA